MPYTIKKNDSEWCVYKQDADGNPTGDTLGCHDTQEKAVAQIGAIESSEAERAALPYDAMGDYSKGNDVTSSLVDRIVERIKVLIDPLLHPAPSPFEPKATHISVYRQADGRWRWFSISATSVLNRVGEIDSRELFDNFVRRFPEQARKPYRTFYHKGEAARMGEVDYIARDGDVFISSGLFDNTPWGEAAAQAIANDPEFWGDSIGYLPISSPELERVDNMVVPVYRDGELLEISTLPESRAANLFTVVLTAKEVTMKKDSKEYADLLRLAGGNEALAEDMLSRINTTQRAITDGKMVTRNEPETAPEHRQDEEMPEGETIAPEEVPSELETLKMEFEELKADVEAIKGMLAETAQRTIELQKADADKIKEHLADMPAAQRIQTQRPKVDHAIVADADMTDIEKANAKRKEVLAHIKH